MPTISLRLTEEEHAQLTAWAHDGHRSVQKELIFRLFADDRIDATSFSQGPKVISPSPLPMPPSLEVGDRDDVMPYFKPDPKPEVKRK